MQNQFNNVFVWHMNVTSSLRLSILQRLLHILANKCHKTTQSTKLYTFKIPFLNYFDLWGMGY